MDLGDDSIPVIDKLDNRLGFFVVATKRLAQSVVSVDQTKKQSLQVSDVKVMTPETLHEKYRRRNKKESIGT